MKSLLSAFAGVCLVLHFSNTGIGQIVTPKESKQSQFLWSTSKCSATGPSTPLCDSAFQRISRTPGQVGLALSHRSLPLQSVFPKMGLDSLSEASNILSSHNFLKTGWNAFVVSSELVPTEWNDNDWWLMHDGEEIELTLDSPLTRYIGADSEATMIGLRSCNAFDTITCSMLLPIFPSQSCIEPDLPPWEGANASDPWWVGCFLNGQPIEGQVFCKMGSDDEFDRPLIFLQGFDPGLSGHFPSYGFGDFNWDLIWECGPFEDYGIPGLADFMDGLLEEGFDLVFLDLENGTQSVENQSALTQEVIKLCRDHKLGNEPMVLVGPSLGGVVGRHALRMMEMDEEQHCTRLFITLDSPFKGAWLPTALQEAIAFFSSFSAEANAMNVALHSPAAGQMLIHSPFHPSSTRQEIDEQQDQWGLPMTPICIATSNGNPFTETSVPADMIFHASESFLGYDYVDISLFTHPGSVTHENSNAESLVIFDAETPNSDWSLGEPLSYSGMAWSASNLPNWNTLPGSYSNHLLLFNSAIEAAGIQADYSANESLFIPSCSAFDISLDSEFSSLQSPFTDISFESAATGSAFHCDLQSHLPFLTNWIVHGQPLNDSNAISSSLEHLGWSDPQRRLIGTFNLEPLGTLEVGTIEANGTGQWPTFQATTNACDATIDIGAGGQMLIGDSLNGDQAELILLGGSRLILNEGSTLHIGRNSSVLMKQDAIVELNGGHIVIHPEGKLIQEANSQLIVNGIGKVQLNGIQSEWETKGDLLLLGHDTLSLSGPTGLGSGIWRWSGNQVYSFIGEYANLKINPTGEESLDIVTSENTGNLFQGTGLCTIRNANFHLSSATNLVMETKARFDDCNLHGNGLSSHVELKGRTNWTGGSLNHVHLVANCPGTASFKGLAGTAYGTWLECTGNGTRLDDFQFFDSRLSLTDAHPLSWIKGCSFDGGTSAQFPQLSVSNSEPSIRCENCIFSSHSKGIEIEEGILNISCSEFENLIEALNLNDDGIVDMTAQNGRNNLHDNATHFRLNNAPVPLLADGNNRIGSCNDATISGSSPIETAAAGGSLLQSLTGNFWPNASAGVPLLVPYTNLYSSIDGGSIQFKDMSPAESTCLSLGLVENSSVKFETSASPTSENQLWTIYPNPAHQWLIIENKLEAGPETEAESMHLRIMDATSRQVFECSLDHGQTKTINVQSFANGIYALEISAGNGQPTIFSVLIQHR